MFKKIKDAFFSKGSKSEETEAPKQEYPLTHIKFRDTIKALAVETYKEVTIMYLAKPDPENAENMQPVYHIFYNKKFYYSTAEQAGTLEEVEQLAHDHIDTNFAGIEGV